MRAGPVWSLRQKETRVLQGRDSTAVAYLCERTVVAQVWVGGVLSKQVEEKPFGRFGAAAGEMLVGELAICLGRQDYCLNVATPVTNWPV
jgi:hypothetical protein